MFDAVALSSREVVQAVLRSSLQLRAAVPLLGKGRLRHPAGNGTRPWWILLVCVGACVGWGLQLLGTFARGPRFLASPPATPTARPCRRGFTGFLRDDYLEWKREGRLLNDGVTVKLLGNHGPLEAREVGPISWIALIGTADRKFK